MMSREWRVILARYGQTVTVAPQGMGEEVRLRAFLQPILERGREQQVPSPLGLRREDRFLYLGPADVPLVAGVSRVKWTEQEYEVQSAQTVGTGIAGHWWAVLRPADKEGL